MEKEFVDAAEAMPEDKFNFAPPATAGDFKGVRSFGAQVKHVTEANYFFFGGGMSEADMKTKADAIEKLTIQGRHHPGAEGLPHAGAHFCQRNHA